MLVKFKKLIFWIGLIAVSIGIEYSNHKIFECVSDPLWRIAILVVETVTMMPFANKLYKEFTGYTLW